MVDRREVGRHRAADLLGGRVGRAQLGPLLLEGLQPPQPDVVVGVRQRRVVEHEVAPAGVLDLLGDLLVLGPRVGRRGLDVLRHASTALSCHHHGNILPPGTDIPSADLRRRRIRCVNVTRSTSQAEPHWTRYDASVRPQALILMLHGGKDRSQDVVDSRSLSWRRSASMQRDIARRAQEAGASVWLLRFTRRGWNGGADRVADARAALDDVRRRLGDVPVVLLGHSMGGRTAVHVADDPNVRGVVALAPWLPPGESVEACGARRCTPPTAAATASPAPAAPPPSYAARPRSPRRPSSPTWVGSATTCCAADGPGTRSPWSPPSGCSGRLTRLPTARRTRWTRRSCHQLRLLGRASRPDRCWR